MNNSPPTSAALGQIEPRTACSLTRPRLRLSLRKLNIFPLLRWSGCYKPTNTVQHTVSTDHSPTDLSSQP
jgi:hypothetical protein